MWRDSAAEISRTSQRAWLFAVLLGLFVSTLTYASDFSAGHEVSLGVVAEADTADESCEGPDTGFLPVSALRYGAALRGSSPAGFSFCSFFVRNGWSLPPNRAPPLFLS